MDAARIAQARLRAEALMVDTCTVTRQTGKVYNQTTKGYDPTYATQYSGKCKVQTSVLVIRDESAGDTEHGVEQWEVHLPVVGSETVQRGDLVTVTAATYDTALAGRLFAVTGPHVASMKSARRLPVEAVVDA
jgi:hypothetical protein